jgi:nucleoid-associated protein YgaU
MSFSFRRILIIPLLIMLAGCGSHDPVWRMKAQLTLLQLHGEDAATSHPDDYASISTTYQRGETLLTVQEEDEEADQQFKLSYQKGLVLKQEVALYKERLKEEARQKAIEERAIREEEQRAHYEAERKRQQELDDAKRRVEKNKKADTQDSINHFQQVTSHTVRRGETLPQIASRPELYNDVALWPLIYRANRDQIRDPYQLWPGQVLKIPRNFSRDEALEARRQAHRRGQ